MIGLAQKNILEAVRDGRAALGAAPRLTFVHVEPDGSLLEVLRSYADLWRNGSAICAALRQEGMGEGDALGLVMHNHAEFVDCMIGSSMAGTVYVPLDPRITGEKLRYMLDFADCRGVVVGDYALPHVEAILDRLPKLEWIWVVGTLAEGHARAGRRYRAMADVLGAECAEQPLRAIDPAAPMQMIFTSGTTGDPKAIRSTHARFMFAANVGPMIGLTAQDKPYTGLPLSHSNAQFMTLGNALTMQLPAVISRKFTKSRLWEILARYGCTTFNLLGGMTTAIFAEPQGAYDRAHKVRFVLSAGMPATMWDEFSERFGVEIFEFYGTAEGGLLLNPPPGAKVGSVGRAPAGAQCEILDDDDNPVADGEFGEICFRNADGTVPSVNYHRNEPASRAKTRGGWFRSGDIGWRDAQGWFYFAHRIGTAIRRNGEFIAPSDVEKVLAEDAMVDDVYVYGVKTTVNAPGEREVVAAIVPARGDFDPAAVVARCRQALSVNSVPSILQFVTEIPKTASEKPQERFLTEMLRARSSEIYFANPNQKIEIGE
ncbi:MAG: AMP-binding protein [Alphaproteobacteria bacterium]|nr:AMP-binding protein [Alphaproteobacteria bacterium]